MSTINKIRLKYMLGYGAAFAGITTLFNLLWDDQPIFWGEIVFKFVFFGAFMGYFMVSRALKRLKQHGITEISESTFAANQSVKFKSRFTSIEEAADRIEGRGRFLRAKINRDSVNQYTIIRTGHLDFGGEEITLKRMAVENEHCYFEVSSKSRNSAGGVDDTENLINVVEIEKLLT